jgi:hypothetical protein
MKNDTTLPLSLPAGRKKNQGAARADQFSSWRKTAGVKAAEFDECASHTAVAGIPEKPPRE